MRTRRPARPLQESDHSVPPKVQTRSWGQVGAEPSQPQPIAYDLSQVDLFSHAPHRSSVQTKLTVQPLDTCELNHGMQRREGTENKVIHSVQRVPEIQAGRGKKFDKPQQKTNKSDKPQQKTNKGETGKKTKGEQVEEDVRKRLAGVNSASGVYELKYGVMDLIAGCSLNGSGGVVKLNYGTIKATNQQKADLVQLLSQITVQAGNTGSSAWHKNDHKKLPVAYAPEGGPQEWDKTPYLEFLIPGFKSKNLMERAVYNTVNHILYMTCHYDVGSFVELQGLPGGVYQYLDGCAQAAKTW